MKKIELKPDKNNILQCLQRDFISRNTQLADFIEMIDYIDDNTSISINGDWGTGKTFFVKSLCLLLEYFNINNNKDDEIFQKIKNIIESKDVFKEINLEHNFVPIYYNAWDNDSHNDPIISLIYTIAKNNKLGEHGKISKSILEKMAEILDVLNPFTNGSIKELIKSEDIKEDIITMEYAKECFKDILNEVLVERGDKLIIFIDELDRCKPVYAVKLLERIKHFFDDERLIFVFSTNLEQLSYTISNFYGNGFNSYRYLNKFFDVQIDLNNVNIKNYLYNIGFHVQSHYFDSIILNLANYYNLTMRECNRLIQNVNIVREYIFSNKDYFKEGKGNSMISHIILPILLVIKINDIKLFIKIINGKGYNEFRNIIKQVDIIEEYIKRYIDENISNTEYEEQLLKIYNTLFNNNGENYFENKVIEINQFSSKYLLELTSLLKKGLNYK